MRPGFAALGLLFLAACILVLGAECRRQQQRYRRTYLRHHRGGDGDADGGPAAGNVDARALERRRQDDVEDHQTDEGDDDWPIDSPGRRRPSGRRTSSWRRWMSQFRPHRLHGAVHFGPGFNVQVDSDFGFTWDVQAKWWLGENVCERTINSVDEEVSPPGGGQQQQHGHQLLYSRSCNGTDIEYRCTTMRVHQGRKTVTTTVYECCPGYRRSRDEPHHCLEEVILTSTVETLESVGAAEMARALDVTGVLSDIEQRNYTVFAPTDEAFASHEPLQVLNDLHVVRVSAANINSVTSILNDIVSGHVIHGVIRTGDFVDDELYETTLKVGSVRLNKYNIYPRPVLTANCVPLVTADVLTTHGVVHVVERVLPSTQQTLEQLVLNHPRLTTFAVVARRLGLSADGPFTLFAPSNDAFDRLDVRLRDRLLSADGCELEILRQHILPRVLCSASVAPGFHVRVLNAGDRYVTLSRAEDSQQVLAVEGANATDTDVMATNGVLHIVDQVLFLDSAHKLLDAAKSTGGVGKFLRLVEQTGMSRRLDAMNNFTLFIPTDDAVQDIADRLEALSGDELRRVVENHVVDGRLLDRALHSGRRLPTLNRGSPLTVKHYHSFPFGVQSRKTVQCASVGTTDINSASFCSGVGHVIDRVLLPVVPSILDVLSAGEFSAVMQLLKATGLADQLQQQDSPITFFAPTNEAFESLSEDALNKLKNDTEVAKRVLRSHMIADVLCCGGVFPRHVFDTPVREVNLDGWMLAVDRRSSRRGGRGGGVRFGGVAVAACDRTASNGVVHAIAEFPSSVVARYLADGDGGGMSVHDLWDYIFNA